MFVWNRSPGKEKRSKRENKNIFVFSFFYIKQLKTCWKGYKIIMEDIKINNDKLNEAIKRNDLPEVPRLEDGKIDIEKISIGKDDKGRLIVSDEIFDSYYKELPDGTSNQSKTFKAYNGGKIKTLTSEDAKIQRMGALASNAKQAQRRSYAEAIDDLLRKKASKEAIEEYELEPNATNLDMVLAAALKQSQRGNIKAIEFLRDTVGEKPTEKISAEVETITPEDRKQIERILNRTKAQDIVFNEDQE